MRWKFRLQEKLFELLPEREIRAQHVVVLLCLASYADWDTGRNARPGVETLARKCAVDEKTVRRCLADGVRLGLITRVRRGGGTGLSATGNTYEFCFDDTGWLAPTGVTADTTAGRIPEGSSGSSGTRPKEPLNPQDLTTSHYPVVKTAVLKKRQVLNEKTLRTPESEVPGEVSSVQTDTLRERLKRFEVTAGENFEIEPSSLF